MASANVEQVRPLRDAATTTLIAAALAFAVRSSAAPVGWFWLLAPALAAAIWFTGTDGSVSAGVAFRRGWLFGTLFVLGDLAWVIGPATQHLGPVIVPIAIALGAIEALPVALAAWAFARASDRSIAGFCFGVPALYALLETARTSGPLGLPLATFGSTQTSGLFAVTLTLGGVPLATFAVLVTAAIVVSIARAARDGSFALERARVTIALYGAGIVLLYTAQFAWNAGLAVRSRAPVARIGIVEAGPIDLGRTFAQSAADYAASTQNLPSGIDFALWPEGVLYLIAPDANAQRASVRAAARRFGRPILAGATLRERGALHNDLLEIGADGRIASLYTKRRLVPFGEYQPFAFGAPKRATYAASAGTDANVRLAGMSPFGALICYEVAFADLTRTSAHAGASYVVAVLNDSWFGATDGPEQLAQILQARAIESGIAIVRADAVPPSGAVDADGRWLGTPLRADGVTVVDVPSGYATPYRRAGPVPALVALALVSLLAIRAVFARSRIGRTGQITQK